MAAVDVVGIPEEHRGVPTPYDNELAKRLMKINAMPKDFDIKPPKSSFNISNEDSLSLPPLENKSINFQAKWPDLFEPYFLKMKLI